MQAFPPARDTTPVLAARRQVSRRSFVGAASAAIAAGPAIAAAQSTPELGTPVASPASMLNIDLDALVSLSEELVGGGTIDRGLWEPYLELLPDGRVTAFYANEKHASDPPYYSQTISQRVSEDGGKTWGEEILAAARQGTARPGMPGVAQFGDGRFILVFEVCATANCLVFSKISDDGVTWSDDLGAPIPEQRAGPYVAALESGQLLATSACTNNISISDDGGQSWALNDTRAWDVECAEGEQNPPFTWPAIYQLPDDRIVVAANVGGKVQLRFGAM